MKPTHWKRSIVALVALAVPLGWGVLNRSTQVAAQDRATDARRAALTADIEPAARDLIERTAAFYREMRSYSDTMELDFAPGSVPLERARDHFQYRAAVAWAKPNRVRVVKRSQSGTALAVSDGATLFAVTPRYPGYYLRREAGVRGIFDALNEAKVGGPGAGLTVEGLAVEWMLADGLRSLKMGATGQIAGAPVQNVVAHFEFSDGGEGVVTMSIGTRDGLLHRATEDHTLPNGKSHLMLIETHSQMRVNPTLPDSTWAFRPPRATQAIDYFSRLDKPRLDPRLQIGAEVAPFKATDLRGQTVALQKLRGKVVLLHFWTTTESSAADVPRVIELLQRFHNKGLEVVGVSMDARLERVTDFVTEKNVPYPILFDGKGWSNAVARLYQVGSLPRILLVGRDGKLAAIGERPDDVEFEAAVAKALATAAP